MMLVIKERFFIIKMSFVKNTVVRTVIDEFISHFGVWITGLYDVITTKDLEYLEDSFKTATTCVTFAENFFNLWPGENERDNEKQITFHKNKLYLFKLINDKHAECHGFVVYCYEGVNGELECKCYSGYGGLYQVQVHKITPSQIQEMIDGNLTYQAIFWGDLPYLFIQYLHEPESHDFRIENVRSKYVLPLTWDDILRHIQNEEDRLSMPLISSYFNEIRKIISTYQMLS